MSEDFYQIPQLLPYPENCLMKKLYKTPILLFRLGLGKLFGNYILILSTTGRKTGKIHRTPVEYFYHEDQYYIISGFGDQPDWYQNISSNPQVTIQTGYEKICATARSPQSDHEWEAIRLYLTHSPVGKLLKVKYQHEQGTDPMEIIRHWPALTFEPTDEPCPPPMEADLVWAWPLVFLWAALDITLLWLFSRKE